MTKKLTGREAVIALMEGRAIKNHNRTLSLLSDQYCVDQTGFHWSLKEILSEKEWEIVPEPMVWEEIIDIGDQSKVPTWAQNKRVKVRIEEILE
jgi:hypothetical protein